MAMEAIQTRFYERLQQHLVDVGMSNGVSRPVTIDICKRVFGENVKVLVSTANRRLPGRMVHEEAQIYWALPYIASASASALTDSVSRFM